MVLYCCCDVYRFFALGLTLFIVLLGILCFMAVCLIALLLHAVRVVSVCVDVCCEQPLDIYIYVCVSVFSVLWLLSFIFLLFVGLC